MSLKRENSFIKYVSSSDSLASIDTFSSSSKSYDNLSELIENTTKLNLKKDEVTNRLPFKKRQNFVNAKRRRSRDMRNIVSKSPQIEDALKKYFSNENKK